MNLREVKVRALRSTVPIVVSPLYVIFQSYLLSAVSKEAESCKSNQAEGGNP